MGPAGRRPREIIDDTFHHVPRVAAPGPFRLRMGRLLVLEIAGQAAPAAFVRAFAGAEAARPSAALQLGDWVPKLCYQVLHEASVGLTRSPYMTHLDLGDGWWKVLHANSIDLASCHYVIAA